MSFFGPPSETDTFSQNKNKKQHEHIAHPIQQYSFVLFELDYNWIEYQLFKHIEFLFTCIRKVCCIEKMIKHFLISIIPCNVWLEFVGGALAGPLGTIRVWKTHRFIIHPNPQPHPTHTMSIRSTATINGNTQLWPGSLASFYHKQIRNWVSGSPELFLIAMVGVYLASCMYTTTSTTTSITTI